MKITRVELNLIKNQTEKSQEKESKLMAGVSLCFDNEFVVNDVKIIAGREKLLVAMPSRKLNDRCPGCHRKTALTDRFCSQCGRQLLPTEQRCFSKDGRSLLYTDIAHPLTVNFRQIITRTVLESYEQALNLEPPSS